MSEQFTMDIQPNPVGVQQRDYLWSSQPIEDLWSGLWGFVRVWGEQNAYSAKTARSTGIKSSMADKEKISQMRRGGEKLRKAKAQGIHVLLVLL